MPVSDLIRRIIGKRQAYRRVLGNTADRDAQMVLADLRKFCGVDRAAYRVSPVTRLVDANATLIAVGRLEVYQRISTFLNINDADLLKLQEGTEEEAKT